MFVLVLVVISKGSVLEYFLVVIVTKDDIGADIVDGVLVDFFEDGGVGKGHDGLLVDFLHHFVGLDFVFFVLSQPKESSEVGVDELFSGGGGFDFGQVFFEELNFD